MTHKAVEYIKLTASWGKATFKVGLLPCLGKFLKFLRMAIQQFFEGNLCQCLVTVTTLTFLYPQLGFALIYLVMVAFCPFTVYLHVLSNSLIHNLRWQLNFLPAFSSEMMLYPQFLLICCGLVVFNYPSSSVSTPLVNWAVQSWTVCFRCGLVSTE